MITRRTFVGHASRSVAALALAGHRIPVTRATGRTTPEAWLPDPTAAETLRTLATRAIDAARDAGASFADVRVGEQRTFHIASFPRANVTWRAGYGVRVLVDGTWGLAHGETLTTDAIASVARDAVAVARQYATVNERGHGRAVELAPAPAVTGEWRSPVVIPPFTVPLDDHVRVLASWQRAVAPMLHMDVYSAARWDALTRVIASSDGTLVTQYVTRCDVEAWVGISMRRHAGLTLRVPGVIPGAAGFEIVMAPEIPGQIAAVTDDVLMLARLPVRSFDATGRFPVVLDGEAMAVLLGTTLGQALDADRVVGLEADAAGRSFLVPGTTAPLSPLVTVTTDRAAPTYTAVGWDDEGVTPVAATLVDHGRVQAFGTTRETAHLLGADGRSMGLAVAPDPTQRVMSGGAHLALAPSPVHATLDALLRGVVHGVLCYRGTCLPEPNVSTGLFRGGMMLEVRAGRPVAHIANLTFQFQTRRWWSSQLRALGDASTLGTTLVRTQKGMPWQDVTQVATAPAALVADVDVVRTDVRPL